MQKQSSFFFISSFLLAAIQQSQNFQEPNIKPLAQLENLHLPCCHMRVVLKFSFQQKNHSTEFEERHIHKLVKSYCSDFLSLQYGNAWRRTISTSPFLYFLYSRLQQGSTLAWFTLFHQFAVYSQPFLFFFLEGPFYFFCFSSCRNLDNTKTHLISWKLQ